MTDEISDPAAELGPFAVLTTTHGDRRTLQTQETAHVDVKYDTEEALEIVDVSRVVLQM